MTSKVEFRVNSPRRRSPTMEFWNQLYPIVQEFEPCTVRQVYYLAVARGLIDKDTGSSKTNYQKVMRALGNMREDGVMDWDWITDNSRYAFRASMYGSAQDALKSTAAAYRRNFWATQPRRVEVWCESDSISGTLIGTTNEYGVPLYPCHGHASKEFVHSAALQYADAGVPILVLYVGDWDPTGIVIDRSVEERMRRYVEKEYGADNDLDVEFQRIAVTAELIGQLNLAGHAANRKDNNYPAFVQVCQDEGLPIESVETEAVPPDELRDMVSEGIEGVIDEDAWEREKANEKAERESWQQLSTLGFEKIAKRMIR